jgi:predicted nucleic acid-binding protein
MSVVSVGEILDGIERMPLGRNRNRLQFWFEGLCRQYAEKTLPTDVQVWRTYAHLKASMAAIGKVQQDMDLLIAACAAVHGATVVTRNTKDFEATGVPLLNPWLIES